MGCGHITHQIQVHSTPIIVNIWDKDAIQEIAYFMNSYNVVM